MRARFDAAGQDAAEEGVGFSVVASIGRARSASSCFGAGTWRTIRSNSGDRSLRGPPGLVGPALRGRGEERREVELLVVGAERWRRGRTPRCTASGSASGLSTLLITTIGFRPQGAAPWRHELGLRHRAFGGVDQQADAVDHRQDALDLAAEIGVAGGVDDVDARALPFDRGRLGQDGDAALAFEVVAVHRAFGHLLVGAEGAGLLEQFCRRGWSCHGRRGR
jgi:hypothetical protein